MKSTREDLRTTRQDALGDSTLRAWSMRSSSGRISLSCELIRQSVKTRAMVCAIKMRGEFFERGAAKSVGELVPDFSVSLSQVLLYPQAVQLLRNRLVEWQTNPASFEVELGTSKEGDQRFSIALAQDSQLRYEIHRPACIITYGSPSAMLGRWAFIVDQSCVRSCAEELRQFLATEGAELGESRSDFK